MSQQYNLALGQERLKEVINAKKEQPMIGNRVTMDWRAAQLALVDRIKHEGVVAALIQFQIEILRGRIPSFYSFFTMQKGTNQQETLEAIKKQMGLIRQGKSRYHSIKAYIKMREELLEKLRRGGNGQGKSLFQDVDDIRFLNFQIIGLVRKWKEEWRVEGALEPSFYQGGVNYLLKINNDNADLISAANFKKTKFISPPNPFFLSQDGNLTGMSAKQKEQIGQCIELIGRQRVSELRMSVQSSSLVNKPQNLIKKARSSNKMQQARKEVVQNSFIKDARNEILISKQEEIKKIYTINRSLESTKNRASLEKMSNLNIRKISKQKQEKLLPTQQDKKYENNYAQMDRFMKVKESSIIHNKLNPSKNRYSPAVQPNLAKISSTNNLRNQIDKVVKQISKPLSPKKREVKEIKPKIKMIEQKQVIVQQDPIKNSTINASSSMIMQASRSITRKNSTFYKKIVPIAEEVEDTPVRPATSSLRQKSISQSNFYPIKQLKYEKERANQRQKSLQNAHQSTIKNIKRQQQLQVRNLNSQLKNLTIINIYKGRANAKKKQKARMNSQPRAEQENCYQQRNRFSSFVAQTNQRNSNSQIEASKLSSQYQKVRNFTDRQFSKLSVQLQKKMTKNKMQQQELRQKQQLRLQAQKQLQMKSLMISQLQKKIKKMQSLKSGINRKQQLMKNHTKQFEKSKKVKQIQQKILKDKIRSEQQKFIQNQQTQLRLRQEQAKLELKKNIKHLEAEAIKQKKQYQKRIYQEQKKMKQMEKMINFEKKKQKQVEKQLEQKKLKEGLLRKMMLEKESQKEKIIQTEKQFEKIVENQIKYREKLQLQALEQIEKEKKKMEAFYQEMVKKNKQLQQQNEKKLKQLQQFDEKKALELQQLRKAEQQFQKKLAQQKQSLKQHQQQKEIEVDLNIDTLKLKLKQQLLQQMLKKQQQQDDQQRLQQQRRQERLRRIYKQVAKALKAEQDTLQKQNAEFLKRIQQMREKVLIPSTHEQDKSSTQEYNSIVNNLQIKSQLEKHEQLPSKMELLSKPSEIVNKQVQSDFKKVQQIKNERLLKINSAQFLLDSSPQKTVKKQEKQKEFSQNNSQVSILVQEPSKKLIQGPSKIRQQPQLQNSKLQEIVLAPSFSVEMSRQPQKQKKESQLSEKKKDIVDLNNEKPQAQQGFLQQQKPKGQAQDLLQKYKNLTQYLKKTRQILIQQKNISNFIDTFTSQLQRTVRQMLPYSKFDLQRIFSSKKMDIFENNTIGWLQQKDKYNLIGNLDCIDTLMKRYGAIQIHQVFIFEKSNPYQKQFLAKKMKIFQKIGFIFQKKLEESQKFSIRFVIKLPKQIAGQVKTIKPKIISKISLQHYQQINKQSLNHKIQFSFSYMISRLLRQNIDKSKLSQIAQSSDHFVKIINDQIQLGPIKQSFKHINIDEVSDSLMEIQMRLPFKYFRDHEKGFFMISCKQHQYDYNHYYTAELQPHITVVIHEVKNINNTLDHVLTNTIKAINKSDKVGNIDVCLPLWNYNKIQVMQSQGLYYSHRQKIVGEYALGSIISTFLLKHQYANIKAPFVLAYCLTDDEKRLVRSISGHLITSDLLVNQHLK